MSSFRWCLSLHFGRTRKGVSVNWFPTDWHVIRLWRRCVLVWKLERDK